jgi:alpha-tubulin suppressor-like RCC1 family protein
MCGAETWKANWDLESALPSGSPHFTEERLASIHGHGPTSFALSETGNLYGWGDNSVGQLGIGKYSKPCLTPRHIPFPAPIIDLAVAFQHALALTVKGSLYLWGNNIYGKLGISTLELQKSPTPLLLPFPDAARVFAGAGSSVVLTKKGELYTWG